MKTFFAILVALCASTHWANAQTASSSLPAPDTTGQTIPFDTPYAVVDRGANHRVWQRTTYETTPDGKQIPHIHKYTELATGLHYQKNGQWVESKEEIDILPNGTAAATQGQHQIYFPGDIYRGVIELVTPDGKHLKSRPLGLSYDDGTNTVLIAELKSSVGQLVGSNQVIYPDAFTDFKADLVCTYRKSGLECDLVFREQPSLPEASGLDPQTSRLELLTEFFNAPEPVETTSGVSQSDGLSDTTLKFGAMTMGRGKVFVVGDPASDNARKPSSQISVYKSWLHLQGRTFLMEEVPYRRISSQLQTLPVPANAASSASSAGSVTHKVSATKLLPPARLVQASTNAVQLAKADLQPKQGVVLDYVAVNSSQSNYTFQADTTYCVSGQVWLYGVTTVEGGAVIKLYGNGQMVIDENGTIDCQTSSYRPGVFTSVNDDSVGERITGSSGSPNYAAVDTIFLIYAPSASLHDLRFSYYGIGIDHECNGAWLGVTNCQFFYGDIVIEVWSAELYNVLISTLGSDGMIMCNTLIGENITAVEAYEGYFSMASSAALTNCLIIGPHNWEDCVLKTNSTVWLPSTSNSVYQTVGAGSYYLANNSPYRNAGTTNISPALLACLRQKTTYPPIVYSNYTFSIATNFSPQAQRDTNPTNVDIGYHYDPLDYVFGGVDAASNLTFTAGTAVGWFELSGYAGSPYGIFYGISLPNSSIANFNGTVTLPCVLTRFDAVQEGGNGLWEHKGYLGAIIALGDTPYDPSFASQAKATFTHFAALADDPTYVRDYTTDFILQANDCEFWSGNQGGYGILLYLTNCLINGCCLGIQSSSSVDSALVMRNCTMRESYILAAHQYGATWPTWIENCVFERTDLSQMDNPSSGNTNITYCDYNAFLTNANRLPMHGAHDVTNIISFNWQSSWLGNYYLPTDSPLIDHGSVTADQVGLYHFTTQTNQVKETNSVVDIGYHYVAVDGDGNPIDTDGDGIPDYLEDSNGNGIYDTGDLGNWLISPFNGLTTANGLLVFTPLK